MLEASWQAGRELSEPRLDTAIDVNRAIARYLELLKLAALAQRPGDEATAEAVEAVNGLLRQVATPEQQAELDASALDSYLLDSERDRDSRRRLIAARHEPSLEAFLPRRGDGGLSLSASDLDLYLTCPLKYKFARVFGIPQEPTINQRFGILIHNVLERFHREELATGRRRARPAQRPARAGLAALRLRHQRRRAPVPRPGPRGDAPLLGARARLRGRTGLARAQVRLPDRPPPRARPGRPGRPPAGRRVRADRLQDRRARRPRSSSRATCSWRSTGWPPARPGTSRPSTGSYYYVLDADKVAAPAKPDDAERVERTVLQVAEGALGQDFEPRPSPKVCSWCDYRLICPAAES